MVNSIYLIFVDVFLSFLKSVNGCHMHKNNLVTIFPNTQNFHLTKDVGQICLNLARHLKLKPTILTYKNDQQYDAIKQEVKGLHLAFIKNPLLIKWLDFKVIFYLIKNARNIALLNVYHPSIESKFYCILYKLLNRKGIAYMKLDLDIEYEKKLIAKKDSRGFLNRRILNSYENLFNRLVDYVSVETNEGLQLLTENDKYPLKKLIKVSNGVDSKYINEHFGEVNFNQKENIIITVGRLGVEQKNTKLLLDALEKTNLHGWKVYLIGPVEKTFQCDIDNFYKNNPHHVNNVIFVGATSDRSQLMAYYKQAKIFILSSNYEGFPLVFPEALHFGNYIISTQVSGAQDITKNGVLGSLTKIGCVKELASAITEKISSDISELEFEQILKHSEQYFTWDACLHELVGKINVS